MSIASLLSGHKPGCGTTTRKPRRGRRARRQSRTSRPFRFEALEERVLLSTLGYWRFEEGSGTAVADSSGLGNIGTLVNGASYTNDVPVNPIPHTGDGNESSLTLDGINDAVVVSDAVSLRPTSGITLEAWFKATDGLGTGVIVGRQFGAGCCSNSYQIGLRPNLFFGVTDASGAPQTIDVEEVSLNEWHHAAGTWDGATMRLYLDGLEVGTAPFAGPIGYPVSNPIIIGADDDGGGVPGCCFFPGNIDEVRISDAALNPSEFLLRGRPQLGRTDYPVGDRPVRVAIGDLNNDGYLDLVSANTFSDSVSVLLGKGDGTFNPRTDFTTGRGTHSVALADIDRDGDLDIVTANVFGNSVSVLLGRGDGTFADHSDFATGTAPRWAVLGDLTGDDQLDIVTANEFQDVGANSVTLLLGSGDGTFASRRDLQSLRGPSGVALEDLNRDGKLDIVVNNVWGDSISIWLGNGDGTVGVRKDLPAGRGPTATKLGDLDGDFDLDIVTSNTFGSSVSVFLGNGNGTFAARTDFGTGPRPEEVSLGDMDGDGDLDIVTANSFGNSVSVLLNNGHGTLAPPIEFSTGQTPMSVSLADLNRDGRLDIVTANASGSVSVLLMSPPQLPPTFVVNSASDPGDGVCDVTECTLREAISAANLHVAPEPDTIVFNVGRGGVTTIRPTAALPIITDPVVIDGTTQPGFAGSPIIELDGSHTVAVNGLAIAASNSVVRGLVINRFEGTGIWIFGAGSTNNLVEGNFIGTDVTGTLPLGKGAGVGLDLASNNRIGGTEPGSRNVISGNQGDGVGIGGDENVVQGNYIGTDVTGTVPLGNGVFGVSISGGARRSLIGTNGDGVADATEGNVIAFNRFVGVGVDPATAEPFRFTVAIENRIVGNSIHSNGTLGIDLVVELVDGNTFGDGPTPNDATDADMGANNLQNFPVITFAQAGAATRVVGTLNSLADTRFALDFYANTAADPSGFGEGERYLGSLSVTTDAAGNAFFNVTLMAVTSVGEFITATATDHAGNTSEFSAAASALLNAPPEITEITSSSPDCGGVAEGQAATVSVTFADLNAGDTHTALINWGDGTAPTAATITESGGAGTISASHVYADGGIYTITVTLSDGSESDMETAPAVITGAGFDGASRVLEVVGTDLADNVTVNMQDAGTFKVIGSFLATPGNQKTFPAAGVGKILILLCGGNDQATVSSGISITAQMDGGAGNDHLKGGAGHDIMLGGDGDDLLVGGSGRDLMIGGNGADRIVGDPDDDILIAGTTAFDANDAALAALLAAWTSARDYATRTANLRGVDDAGGNKFENRLNLDFFLKADGPDATVSDDGAKDVMTGSAGQDWFFANLDSGVLDKITDLTASEFADDIDFITSDV